MGDPGDASLADPLRAPVARGVEFIVVDGLAALLRGAPIMTLDVDIVHRRTPENVAKLALALADLNATYRFDSRGLRPDEGHLIGPGHQLLRTKYGDLDVLGTIGDGVTYYEDLLEHSSWMDVDGLTVRVLSLEQVIISKRFANRPKDLAMLPTLDATLAELRRAS